MLCAICGVKKQHPEYFKGYKLFIFNIRQKVGELLPFEYIKTQLIEKNIHQPEESSGGPAA